MVSAVLSADATKVWKASVRKAATVEDQAGTDRLVGLVAGTEDATPLTFRVAVLPDAYLQLDDVVVTQRVVPGVGPVRVCGIVTEVRSRHEGAAFDSDVFLINDGVLPAQVQELAQISTTRSILNATYRRVRVPRSGAPLARSVNWLSPSTGWNARSVSGSAVTATRCT